MANIWLIDHYVTTPDTGIGGRHFQMARVLGKRGHKVTVIAAHSHHMLREGVDRAALPETERFDGFDFVRIPVASYSDAHDRRRILAWIGFAFGLWRRRKKIAPRPDAILYVWPQPIGFTAADRIAQAFGARLILEVRDIWPLTLVELGGYSPHHIAIRFFQWLEDRAYGRADRVISNLRFADEHMVSRGMDRGKFYWISNGFTLEDTTRLAALPSEIASRIPRTGLRVAYTGTLGAANGLGSLIEAANLVRDLPISFLLVGQGKNRASQEARRDELRLANVHFLGAVPKSQVQSILSEIDVAYIGLAPEPLFRYGVSPNKLFEYLAAGKPVLYAIDSGEFRPIEEHHAGLQVPAGDASSIADALRRFLAMSKEDRELMGRNAYAAAVENYDYSKLAVRMERVLLDPGRETERSCTV